MKSREAKAWLKATPSARQACRLRNDGSGDCFFSYVPQLRNRDVQLDGDPLHYATEYGAISAAKRFQDAIRSNHPKLT